MTSLKNCHIEVDTHTHTVLSGHAWSTLKENCEAAAAIGLKGLCLTEHGPAMKGAAPWFAPCSHKMLPEELFGVKIFPGLEFNIVDFEGNVDNDRPSALAGIHFGIASMHDVIMPLGTPEQHTCAYIKALDNPYVDILGHPGYTYFPNHPEEIVLAAKKKNKLIEINNNSFTSRPGCRDNCIQFAKMCKKHEVRICISSDSHYYTMIGKFPKALEMLDEIGFPEELIVNRTLAGFEAYMREREGRF